MAQLRRDYPRFAALDAAILIVVPNGPNAIRRHIEEYHPPYTLVTDKGGKTAETYFQVKQFFMVGTPTVLVVDRAGIIRYAHYASSVLDEPGSEEPLRVLASLRSASPNPSSP